MRLRLVALTAAAALAALALPGQAAPKPQITDPSGDGVVAGLDIVSALFATKGKTTRVGKRTVYTPKSLEVTVTYAGPAETADYASQYVLFDLTGCGAVYLQRYSGGTYATAECLPDTSFEFDATVKGSSIVFSLPFNVIGKQFKKGSLLTDLRTLTGVADPVVGLGPADVAEELVVDTASTTASYRVA